MQELLKRNSNLTSRTVRRRGGGGMMNEEPKFVTCPECGTEQGDMGVNIKCEECGYGPMPYYDENGDLHD